MGSGSDDKSADSVEAQVDVQADAGALPSSVNASTSTRRKPTRLLQFPGISTFVVAVRLIPSRSVQMIALVSRAPSQ